MVSTKLDARPLNEQSEMCSKGKKTIQHTSMGNDECNVSKTFFLAHHKRKDEGFALTEIDNVSADNII